MRLNSNTPILTARGAKRPKSQINQFGATNTSLSVSYLYFRGVHISRTRDINLGTPVPVTVTDPAGQTFSVLRHPAARSIPGFARISLFESTADSRYNALAMELKRRFTRGFQFIAAYTFSDTNDNRPDQTMVVRPTGFATFCVNT